jgi:hypothetical protein
LGGSLDCSVDGLPEAELILNMERERNGGLNNRGRKMKITSLKADVLLMRQLTCRLLLAQSVRDG